LDASGWEEVYAAHYRRLVALLTVVAGGRTEAEEAVQEAFVRALGLTGRRAVVDDPEAWLYRVAVNHVRSRWRRLVTARRHAPTLARDEFGPSDNGEADDRLLLVAALRRLPAAQREVLALHYMRDLSIDEIAARIEAPSGTVKARLSRGRDALRRELGAVRDGGAHAG
jgi:RNA polymerase sigma-70 factor (ECF subfamily)